MILPPGVVPGLAFSYVLAPARASAFVCGRLCSPGILRCWSSDVPTRIYQAPSLAVGGRDTQALRLSRRAVNGRLSLSWGWSPLF